MYNELINKDGCMKRADATNMTKALVDWLDDRYKDKTITTEISINTTYGVKVADVVLSNGHAIAFEIKSEFDTTKRLDSQINGYSEVFEYIYLVYWEDKYNIESLNLPQNIGIIKAFWDNESIAFKIIKKAKINNFATPTIIANLLWKSELEYFLKQKNIKVKSDYDKTRLVSLFVENFNKMESKKIFRFILKKRFEKGFLAYKAMKNTSDALFSLMKHKTDKNYLLKI